MAELEERYINPLTDFGFKRLFGSEFNKELLISFLNTLLDGEQNIEDVTSLKNTRAGHIEVDCLNASNREINIRLINDFTRYRIVCNDTLAKTADIANFSKTENELETMFDKWLYVLKNLAKLSERPAALQERVFTRLFQQAEIVQFNKEEMRPCEDSVKA